METLANYIEKLEKENALLKLQRLNLSQKLDMALSERAKLIEELEILKYGLEWDRETTIRFDDSVNFGFGYEFDSNLDCQEARGINCIYLIWSDYSGTYKRWSLYRDNGDMWFQAFKTEDQVKKLVKELESHEK